MGKILLIGEDSSLLKIRSQVLIHSLKSDVVCRTPSELTDRWSKDSFGLVILCHTLDSDLKRALIQHARSNGSSSKFLELSSRMRSVPIEEADASVEADPERMVKQVSKMLVN